MRNIDDIPLKDKVRYCRICKILLTIENAWVNRTRNCLQNACKNCQRNLADQWIKKNHDKELMRRRQYYIDNKAQVKKSAEKSRLKRKYNLTFEQVESMRLEQQNLCAICKIEPAEHIDHNHITNEVRQLLCNNCNSLLGMAKENIDILRSAVDYILKWNN
jgi:hypothetical protein